MMLLGCLISIEQANCVCVLFMLYIGKEKFFCYPRQPGNARAAY